MSEVVFEAASDRLLRLPEVQQMTSLSRSTIYKLIGENRFPLGVQIATRRRGWLVSDISAFIKQGQR